MELKEGMYVRTKNLGGSIEKIIEIIPKEKTPDLKIRYITDVSKKHGLKITDDYIIGEPSYDPIDLIELGDYVNGYKVVDFDVTYFNGVDRREKPQRISVIVDRNSNLGFCETYFKNEDIKSIVTKEQMEAIKYVI